MNLVHGDATCIQAPHTVWILLGERWGLAITMAQTLVCTAAVEQNPVIPTDNFLRPTPNSNHKRVIRPEPIVDACNINWRGRLDRPILLCDTHTHTRFVTLFSVCTSWYTVLFKVCVLVLIDWSQKLLLSGCQKKLCHKTLLYWSVQTCLTFPLPPSF